VVLQLSQASSQVTQGALKEFAPRLSLLVDFKLRSRSWVTLVSLLCSSSLFSNLF
jgi:hypothetical protein